MALSVETLSPNSTGQTGTAWTVVGAASAHAALSSGSNTDYIQSTSRAITAAQVCRLGFPALALPAGSRIYSVAIRVTTQTVTYPAPQPQSQVKIQCTRPDLNILTAIILLILYFIFGWRCPRTPTDPNTGQPTTTAWIDQTVKTYLQDPEGHVWTETLFNPFTLEIQREDSNTNAVRHSEVRVDVSYAEPAAITITGPTGTIVDTCRHTAVWAYTSPQSDPQVASRVAVYTAAQVALVGFVPFITVPAQQSGWVLGPQTTWTFTDDTVNGVWHAFVQVRSKWEGSGTFESATATTSWTQDVPGAAIPILSGATFDPGNNRVELTFLPGGPTPATVAFRVEACRDGATWGPVRGGLLKPANAMSTVTLHDYEAPLGVPSSYRVLAYAVSGSIYVASDDYSSQLSVTPYGLNVWLKDPLNPALNSVFPVASIGDTVTRQRSQGVFPVISGGAQTFKIVVNGPQYGVEGTFTLNFTERDPADYWAAFQRLDESGRTLLVQYPTDGEQHYIKFGAGSVGQDMQSTWDPNLQSLGRRYTQTVVSYTEVEKPEITE